MEQLALRDFALVDIRPLELAVTIPVLNERDNVAPLLYRLSVALADVEWEAVFVDDGSTDGTAEEIEACAAQDRRVRLIRRVGRRGLSSAVMEGFLSSMAPVLAVIDGDMQHDERVLPQLYRAIADGGCELAIGTRYSDGGSVGEWEAKRVKISRFATQLAAPFVKTPLSDPMSGFFALRRDVALEVAGRLSTVGYKILLDIAASMPRRLAVAEVPYEFRARTAGSSKLDSAVALEYFELLLDKAIGRYVPVKFIMFGAIGALGTFVHLAALAVLLDVALLGFANAQAGAVAAAMLFNYALNNQFTYRDRRRQGWRWVTGFISFALACGLGAVANVGIGSMIYDDMHNWWMAGLAGAVVGSVWNYVAASWLTWRRR